MALLTKAPRGTQDILPADSYRWQHVEALLMDTARLFGFEEIRVPVFEHTELFCRSVGDTTDVVQKEMYTFEDKGGRSITLRPEGTAGVARAVLEHGLYNGPLPLKVCYDISCYRYEKPQAGRLREFHQFGAELYGSSDPSADAEMILLAQSALRMVGVDSLRLELNSIGCPECRKEYHKALKEYFSAHVDELCDTCKGRLERNPMRILDCKSPVCSEIAKGAPTVLDYICGDCREHFEGVKQYLDAAGVSYTVNPTIVRGLDYYTRTVFEFIAENIGAQATVCGGGRYDGLMQELGGPSIPALGFAMGLERLLMVLAEQGVEIPQRQPCEVYIVPMGDAAKRKAFELTALLRAEGFSAQCDLVGRGLKAQMKYANKIGARFTLVLGDNELNEGKADLKNMADGSTVQVDLGEGLIDAVYKAQLERELGSIAGAADALDVSGLLGGLKHE